LNRPVKALGDASPSSITAAPTRLPKEYGIFRDTHAQRCCRKNFASGFLVVEKNHGSSGGGYQLAERPVRQISALEHLGD